MLTKPETEWEEFGERELFFEKIEQFQALFYVNKHIVRLSFHQR